jgi:tetratricopeptide (TPR) repeat protein
VEGLSGGAAAPYDERITMDALYQYVYKRAKDEGSPAKPQRYVGRATGDLVICRNPNRLMRPYRPWDDMERQVTAKRQNAEFWSRATETCKVILPVIEYLFQVINYRTRAILFRIATVTRESVKKVSQEDVRKMLRRGVWIFPVALGIAWLLLSWIRTEIVHDERWPLRQPSTTAEFLARGIERSARHDSRYAIEDFDRVVHDYEQDQSKAVGLADALYRRGQVYLDSKDFGKAIDDFSRIIVLTPKSANAYHMRGEAYLAGNNYGSAIDDFTKEAALTPTGHAYESRGRAYFERANSRDCPPNCDLALTGYDSAISDYGKAVSLDEDLVNDITPRLSETYNKRGQAYHKRADARRRPTDFDLALTDYDNAVADYNKAISLHQEAADDVNSRLSDVFYMRGTMFSDESSKKDNNRAIAEFNQVAKYDSRDTRGYVALGDLYNGMNKQSQAIEAYTNAIEVADDEPDAFKGRGLSYYNQNQFKLAIEDFDKAISLESDDNKDEVSRYYRGLAKLKLGMCTEGRNDIKEARDIDKEVGPLPDKCVGSEGKKAGPSGRKTGPAPRSKLAKNKR